MTAQFSVNPLLTTTAAGTFSVDAVGAIQGTVADSPTARYFLSGGVLASGETLPMWGGIGIYEELFTPSTPSALKPSGTLGNIVGRAVTAASTAKTASITTQLIGFSVFGQAHAMINSPQSPVPLTASGGQVNFYRFGSGARIWVAADPDLVSQEALSTSALVGWDLKGQTLQPYLASNTTYALSAVTWAATAGGQITATVASSPPFVAGDYVDITGGTNTGTGTATAFNSTFVVVSLVGTTLILTAPAASGYYATLAGSPVANLSGGSLPVQLLDLQVGNCMTVSWDPVGLNATWNRNGSCALIQI